MLDFFWQIPLVRSMLKAVDAGTVILVSANKNLIVLNTIELLENDEKYKAMSSVNNPYGDGNSSEVIGDILVRVNL